MLALTLILLVLLQFQVTQDYLTGKAINYLESKTGTKVAIEKFSLRFPKSVVVHGVYLEDLQKDTLLYAGSIAVDISMLRLFRKEVKVNSLSLENIFANVHNTESDSLFNYQFLIDAFAPKTEPETVIEPEQKSDTTASAWNIILGELRLLHVRLNYLDAYNGNDFRINLGELVTKFDAFDLNAEKYHIHSISLKDTDAYGRQKMSAAKMADTTEVKPIALDLDIGKIELSNVKLDYHHFGDGMILKADIGHFKTSFDEFALKDMRFILNDVLLENSTMKYSQYIVESIREEVEEAMITSESVLPFPEIGFKSLQFSSLELEYLDEQFDIQLIVDFGDFLLIPEKIDLNTEEYLFKSVKMHQSYISFASGIRTTETPKAGAALKKTAIEEKSTEGIFPNLSFQLNRFNLHDNHIQYADNNQPRVTRGFDYNYIDLKNFNIDAKDIALDSSSLAAQIMDLAFADHSGFEIKQLIANLNVTDTDFGLEDLLLQTNHSRISRNATAQYSSLQHAIDNPGKIQLQLDIGAEIGFRDLEYFSPDLFNVSPMRELRNDFAAMDIVMQGRLDNLNIDRLKGSILNSTELLASGTIQGLPETENLAFDIKVAYLKTTEEDLRRLLPDSLMPEDIMLPGVYEIKADISGNLDSILFDVHLLTDCGEIVAEGLYTLKDSIIGYRANTDIIRLDLGYILNMGDTLGKLSMQANIDGKGTDLEVMQMIADFKLDSLFYSGYTYRDMEGNLEYVDQILNANIHSLDENLKFNMDVTTNMTDTSYPIYEAFLLTENFDLQALNLSEDKLNMEFSMQANWYGTSAESLNGGLLILDFDVFMDTLDLHLDSLLVSLEQEPGNTLLKMKSDFINLNWESNFPMFQTGDVLYAHLNHYIAWFTEDTTSILGGGMPGDTTYFIAISDTMEYVFAFDVEIIDGTFITEFLAPEFQSVIPDKFEGNFNSGTKNLEISIEFPQIVYNGTEIEDLIIYISSDKDSLTYLISAGSVGDTSMRIKYIELAGNMGQDIINTSLTIYDNDTIAQFRLGGSLKYADDTLMFSFGQDQMLLNYEQWDVSPQNQFIYTPTGMSAQQFIFSKGNQRFGLEDMSDNELEFLIEHFDLSEITKIIDKEEDMIEGTLNANAFIKLDSAEFSFTSEVKIDNLSYMQQFIGNVELLAANRGENNYEIDLDVTYTDYHARARGFYTIAEDGTDKLDFNVDILNFNLSIAEPFTKDYLKDIDGTLTGTFTVGGSSTAPKLDGFVVFNDAAFTILMIDSRFNLSQERILFDAQGVHFNEFTMSDQENNKAILDGSLLTTDFTDYRFNLDLKARNFRAINSTNWVDDLYRGALELDCDLRIRGNMELPVVSGEIVAKNSTNFMLMIPAYEAAFADMEGIVVFINQDDVNGTEIADTTEIHTTLSGFKVDIFLRTERDARFAVLMDPTGNDVLNIQGLANLNLGINPAGVMTLTGRYEIVAGSYQLAFMGVVNRRFIIDPGSSLIWTGDPYSPMLDIRAVYNLRASPQNLLASRMPDVPPQARQTFPFSVQLNMKGNLMNPDLSFGISLPEEARGAVPGLYPIIQELNQEQQSNELNKQVFFLLVLNTFMAQDPLAGSGGGSTEAMARRTVSSVLSQQLNRLAGQYISGFELNIGIESYEDYSSGDATGRTEVQLGFTRRFLDNRLTIEIGGSVDVEGEHAREQKGLGEIAGNLSVEYNITKDGRFRAKAFREQTFENVIDGQLIQTGIGLIYVRDYNRFRDLLRRTRPNTSN